VEVGQPTTSAQGGRRWLSHHDIAVCTWVRAGWHTRLLSAGWLTSGPSAASYVIKDFRMSNFEIKKCELSDVQNLPNFLE
jgi:hypothetical protein